MGERPARVAGVGRPRKYGALTERKMVMDAAVRVMGRSGYSRMSVAAVLAEAGLSTRSFYRHFASKQDLLRALMEREIASVQRSLQRAVAAAPDPVAALGAWLDRFLDVYYEPTRASRTALFSASLLEASYPFGTSVLDMRRHFCEPLVVALRDGHERGLLWSASPEADALSVYELASVASDRHERPFQDRAEARAHVERFVWPALRLSDGGAAAPAAAGMPGRRRRRRGA